MRVFKTTYKDKSGQTRKAPKWYVEFKDHLEIVRRLPAFESKAASEELGRNLEKLVAYHKATGGQTDPALMRFLTGLSAKIRDKLVSIGLLAAERVAVAKRLADHLADFAAALIAKGSTARHVELVRARAQRVFEGCGFRFYGDISASKVMEFLHTLRADSKDKRGISAQTFNFHLQAVKQFCRWMVRDRRAIESPLAHLEGLNVKTDRRRDRRAFTVDELRALLDSTRSGPTRYDMEGGERSLLYWLAVETGLRSNELRSLKRTSFAFDAHATVTVEAAYSKRRREDSLLLRPALAQALQKYLSSKMPKAQAFCMPSDRKKAANMFRADVEAAGIPYRDDSGLVADFHALRHTFITNLANGGIHPKTAQTLARHCSITLTMDRYSHTLRGQEAEALAVLPDLSGAAPQCSQDTRTTDDHPHDTGPRGENDLASCLALSNGFQGATVDCDGLTQGDVLQCENAGKTAVFLVSSASRRGGRAADCTGLESKNGRFWLKTPSSIHAPQVLLVTTVTTTLTVFCPSMPPLEKCHF